MTPSGFFFTARTLDEGREAYFCDGASAWRVPNVDGGNRDGVPSGRLIYSAGKLFFTGNEEDTNYEPWVLPSAPTLALADVVSVNESAGTATATVRAVNEKITSVFGVTPTVFIPPENLFNNDTISVLKSNGFTHISYATTTREPPIFKKSSFYEFPVVPYTAILDPSIGLWRPLPMIRFWKK